MAIYLVIILISANILTVSAIPINLVQNPKNSKYTRTLKVNHEIDKYYYIEKRYSIFNEIHVPPDEIYISITQSGVDLVNVVVGATYENKSAVFMLDNITFANNNTINVSIISIKKEDTTNSTLEVLYFTLGGLSPGNYTLKIIEKDLGKELTSVNFTIKDWRLAFANNHLSVEINGLEGMIVNNTAYVAPFPLIFTAPIDGIAYLWSPTKEDYFIVFNITRNVEIDEINVTLFSPNQQIRITPTSASISEFTNKSFLMVFKVNNTNVSRGLYDINYLIEYKIGNSSYNVSGKIPLAIYEFKFEYTKTNSTLKMNIITPFGNSIEYTGNNWTFNGQRWVPSNSSVITRFTSQTGGLVEIEAIPIIAAAAVAAGGFVVGAGATIVCEVIQGKSLEEIDWGKVVVNGVAGAVGATAIVVTAGGATTAVAGFVAGAKAAGTIAVNSFASTAAIETAGHLLTHGGDINITELESSILTKYTDGLSIDFLAGGLMRVAAAKHLSKVMKDPTKYQKGVYKEIRELWEKGEIAKAIDKFLSVSNPFIKRSNAYKWAYPLKSKIPYPILKKIENIPFIGGKPIFWDFMFPLLIKGTTKVAFTDEYGTHEIVVTQDSVESLTTLTSNDDIDSDGILNYEEYLSNKNPFDQLDGFVRYSILSPTESSPVIVGDPEKPKVFTAIVDLGLTYTPQIVFDSEIGGKPAPTRLIGRINESYVLEITPPKQTSEGSYDLTIRATIGSKVFEDTVADAVIYSKGSNVDVILVIDKSGSMAGNKIADAKNAAKLFVDLMKINDMIGVVSFGSSAIVNYGLTPITSISIKDEAKSAIDHISVGGSTSIGAGLQKAYNEFSNKGNPLHPKAIVLMSDGMHNTPPNPDEILPYLKADNIKVYTIGLGRDADSNMLNYIASQTGGKYYYSPSSQELAAIYNTIASIVKSESIIKNVHDNIQIGEVKTYNMVLDDSIDIVTFTVTYNKKGIMTRLKRPDGTFVNINDSNVYYRNGDNYETYTIKDPQPGKWAIIIECNKVVDSNAVNSAYVYDNDPIPKKYYTELQQLDRIQYTITVSAETSLTAHLYTDKNTYYLNEPIKLTFTLHNSGIAIPAKVYAEITKPNDAKITIPLYDDGKHNDGNCKDGIYSNYFTQTDISGSYNIKVIASGVINNKPFSREVEEDIKVIQQTFAKFEILPNHINKWNLTPGEDVIITLKVTSTSDEIKKIKVTLTEFASKNGKHLIIPTKIMPEYLVFTNNTLFTYVQLKIPNVVYTGNYTGYIIVSENPTLNSISIPISLEIFGLQDYDGDSISDAEEQGPYGNNELWDGNKDNIPDWKQPNVVSMHSNTGHYITLATQYNITSVLSRNIDEYGLPKLPVVFPYGLFNFTIEQISAGSTVNIKMYIYDSSGNPINVPKEVEYWKYSACGIGSPFNTPGWYKIQTIASNNTIEIRLTDGGTGDDDGIENGIIVDPGGPGILKTVKKVPLLNIFGLITLISSITVIGIVSLNRKKF